MVWAEITLPPGEPRPELERVLREVIQRQTRRVDWGRRAGEPVEARLVVTELSAVVTRGVVRVTCAGYGRLRRDHQGGTAGKTARSRFSMGGHPKDRDALERHLLTMLGRGIVTRLADIARAGL